ncbi:MAG: hypothetical protein ACREQL_12510, partial [Candidatus Binatia bacterium]
MNGRVLAFAIAAGLGLTPMAQAYFAGGGKDAAKGNDCLIGYEGIDASDVTLDGKKQVVSCTDCDPACDLDGDDTANGSCTFGVGACINQPGVEGCTPPAGLTRAKASGKASGVKGRIDIDVPQLLEGSVCGALIDLGVPTKKNGTKNGAGTVSLSAQVKKYKNAGIDKTRKDNDKVTYVCVPRPAGEACPAATTSTSTTNTSSTTSTSTTSTSTTTTSSLPPTTTSTTVVATTSTTLASTTSTTVPSTTSTTVTTTTSTSTPSTSITTTTTSTTVPPDTTTSTTVPTSTSTSLP